MHEGGDGVGETGLSRREFICGVGCAGMAAFAGCASSETSEGRDIGMSTEKSGVDPEGFSYCGLDCSACDVYKATVHGDEEARMRAVKVWTRTAQQHWGMETLDPMILDCRGCRAKGPQHKGYGRCPIRRCARERGVASCGLCPEWEECRFLSELLADVPEARGNLQKIAQDAGG